ncbi:hypothetical protein, partial [Pseudomonas aeruginosa]|uniref:hypothetical protein n=1 Tax=Pseudomonas aeruginosa TaxID=287 RepID=UPI0039BE2AD2
MAAWRQAWRLACTDARRRGGLPPPGFGRPAGFMGRGGRGGGGPRLSAGGGGGGGGRAGGG